MKMVDMMTRAYQRALSYRKKEDDGKMGRSDERMARTRNSTPCVRSDSITTTMDRMARSVDMGVRRTFTTSFALALVNSFKMSTTKTFSTCVRGIRGLG